MAAALMFLVADQVMERRGGAIAASAPMAQSGLVSALFFGGAIAMAGMPPLSGFVGKLLVLDAVRDAQLSAWIWVRPAQTPIGANANRTKCRRNIIEVILLVVCGF